MKINLNILNKLIYDCLNVSRSLALNEIHIELASLIICLINYNLTKTTSTPPLEVKNSIIYIKFNNFVLL